MPSQISASVAVTDGSGNSQIAPAGVQEFDPAQTGLTQPYYQYQATVANLNPSSLYSYQIQAANQPIPCSLSRPLQFRTADSGPFSFLHFADSGMGNDNQAQLGQQMGQEQVSLALANGDLAYQMATFASVDANYYGAYCNMMAQIPFFASLGNHEYYTQQGAPSLAARAMASNGVSAADAGRYYSFDWGNVHFVALDSNQPLVNAIAGTGQMLTWLDNDLRQTRKFWRVVFFHHPGYATGHHQDEPPAGQVRQYIVPILEKYGVQLVFNGHEHTYQRTYELLGGQSVDPNSGGIVYVTSGGGGADTYWTAPNELIAQSVGINNYVRADVSGGTMTLHARGLGQSDDIDSIALAPRPQIYSAVNSASYNGSLASGGAVTIFGRNLSPGEIRPSATAAMTDNPNCAVSLNGSPIPILYAGAGQINAQIPFSFSGEGTLVATTANGSAELPVVVNPVAPQIFLGADGLALAIHSGGLIVSADEPAQPLETITVLATGLGEGNTPVAEGIRPPAPVPVMASVSVQVNGIRARLFSAVVSAQAAGVYEITLQVPSVTNPPFSSLQIFANGVASNQAPLASA